MPKPEAVINNWRDEEGNPKGGVYTSPGVCISWQNGPLGQGPDKKQQTGAMPEDPIKASLQWLKFLNSKYHSPYNDRAIVHLQGALDEMAARKADREKQGTEGTNAA